MKTDDAVSQHPFENLLTPGADAEMLRVRPGNMPKHDHGGAREPLTNQSRSQSEVVVLNQDNWILRIDLLTHGVGKLLVDGLVVAPVVTPKDRAGMGNMAERP